MKQRITFFLLVTLAAALAHFLIVLLFFQVVISGAHPLFVIVLWLFTLPMNFLLSSPFGHTLSPIPSLVLFIANSLIWGSAVGAVILWWRLRYKRGGI